MPKITFPDGNSKIFEAPVSALQIAEAISPRLAKVALAACVNQKLVDLSFVVEHDAHVKIITDKDPEGLDVIRHSTAHLLAQAVKRLFPTAQVTIGPVIENGFYYDFAFGRPFTPEDLIRIEEVMQALVAEDFPVTRREITRAEGIDYFRQQGEEYKAKIIEDIPTDQIISLYRQGEFEDLCRGPHVPSTGRLAAFKLMKVAGAYWRGDAKNEMLQRIYGTAWPDKKALQNYLHCLAEAEKRDHRKIGKLLDLFHVQEEAPGMVFWHDKGCTIYRIVENYIRDLTLKNGYLEVKTPQILDVSLWQKSGHWDMFGKEMFALESDDHLCAVKPMNCPCHIQIFNHQLRSYRDLPLRLTEFGGLHRKEPSGALHGTMRLRSFVQDDAHIFCTEDQIQAEVSAFIDLLYTAYRDFGFDEVILKLSTRPEQRVGADETWDKAEKALAEALDNKQLAWQLSPGEGAFYGPKIEFSLRDCLGRVWQCGTIQVDFSMPGRLGAYYIAEDNTKQTPVMIHRAILGSLERFIGILIEHYAGIFPTWLAPTQVVVINITEKQDEYVREITRFLQQKGLRANFDLRNEKIGFKIREHTLQRVPYLLVIGDREMASNTVAVRTRAGADMGVMSLDTFYWHVTNDIASRGRIETEEK